MGPARQTMTVCAVVCVAAMSVFFFSSVADSAPTSSKSSDDAVRTIARLTSQTDLTREKPLTRTKRAEEILFGNHQNAPRVKKSDPAATALATSPAEGQVKAAAGDDVIAAAVKTDDNSLPSEENDNGAEEEEEHLFPVENQDEEQEEGDDQNSFEGIPMEETDFPRYEGQDQPQQPQQQQLETVRRKRNARTAALMTAENMMVGGSVASAANRPIRAKRDLDYEELRELFENSRESPYEAEEEEEYDGDDFRPVAVVPVLPEDDRQNEEEAEEEEEAEAEEEMNKRGEGPLAVAIPYDYEPRYDASSDKVELIRELVKQKAEEDAKEKLIDYLLAAAIASSEEESEDGDEDSVGGGGRGGLDVDDGRRLVIEEAPVRPDFDGDEDDDDDDDREAIGPLAAAAAKRSVFYPYSYEPYGGRWGAMVPGAKRSADEYERLYRLAEALNADDDNDYEEK